MDNKNKIIIVIISLLVVGFMVWSYFGISFVSKTDTVPYSVENMGISFELPSNYFIQGFESGDGLFNGFEAYEDNETTRALLNGQLVGELPVSISCFAFENPENLSIEEWVLTDDFKTVFFVNTADLKISDYVSDVADFEFFSDGLYGTKNVLFKDKTDKIFNCRVTYITLEDQIIKDFEKILSSMKFF